MSGKTRNYYTEDYKASAVSRVDGGETVSAVSESLGIGYQTLWTWCQERGVCVRQKRGPYKKHERCPMCGASANVWRKEKLGLTDLNAIEPAKLEPVHFTPEETITYWDENDEEWTRYDPYSEGWECSGCKYTLMGGDDCQLPPLHEHGLRRCQLLLSQRRDVFRRLHQGEAQMPRLRVQPDRRAYIGRPRAREGRGREAGTRAVREEDARRLVVIDAIMTTHGRCYPSGSAQPTDGRLYATNAAARSC